MASLPPPQNKIPSNVTTSPDPLSGGAMGPLAALEGSGYDFSSTSFPLDIGSPQRGHYIIFNINIQNGSQYVGQFTKTGGLSNAQLINNQNGTIQSDTFAGNNPANGQKLTLSQQTARVTQAIALYMPDTMVTNYNASYDVPSFTDAAGGLGFLAQAGKSIADWLLAVKAGASPSASDFFGGNIGTIAEAGGNVLGGGGAGQFALFAAGYAVNPQLEVIFRSVDFRQFQFDFKFAPTNADEAAAVREIIKQFKFHQAPELSSTQQGRYFILPSTFDIEFIYNGQENTNINRVSTCVLENIDIDNAASGQWATFNDGMPVETRIQLRFREIVLITKSEILQGY